METFQLIVIVLILLITIYYIYKKYTFPSNLPPGPRGYPIIGCLSYMKPRTYLAFMRMKKRFGDIIYLHMGSTPCVVLTSYRAVKEAFVSKGDNFVGRPQIKFLEEIHHNKGVSFVEGKLWQEHRRFSLQVLRDFGFGRQLSEEIILKETDNLMNIIDDHKEKSIDTLDLLTRTASNVISTIILGEQPGYKDECFEDVMSKIRFHLQLQPFAQPFFGFQWMYNIPLIFRFIPQIRIFKQTVEQGFIYITDKIKKHKQNLDINGEPNDFIDAYLQKQHKLNLIGEPHTFCDFQLYRIIFELFVAGTDTTSSSITWGLFLMALNPEIQTKAFSEINSLVEREGRIQYNLKKKMPYVSAVLDEIQRFASISSNSVMRRNLKDEYLFEYYIPANTVVIPCLYALHRDPDVWEKPNDFFPNHFLNIDGLYRTRKELIPFSLGRRVCLGESLALREYFLIFVCLLRRYEVSLDKDFTDVSKLDEVLIGTDAIVRLPSTHKIHFKIRN